MSFAHAFTGVCTYFIIAEYLHEWRVVQDPSKGFLFPIRDQKINRTTAVFFRNACFFISSAPFCVFQTLHDTDVFRSSSVMTNYKKKTVHLTNDNDQRPLYEHVTCSFTTVSLCHKPTSHLSVWFANKMSVPMVRNYFHAKVKRPHLISKTHTLLSTIPDKRVFFQTLRSFVEPHTKHK